MELRQLRYFVTVADELHFGRAAGKLLIAGPSLSQQIKALERDLGLQLFVRDHRSVVLTPAGSALLPHARALLESAADLRRRAERLSGSEPVRIGYVNWRPADLTARVSGVAQLHIDPWVVPSHAQAARVADGSLDLGILWARKADLAEHGLNARLLGADRLYAVSTGPDTTPVKARELTILLDADTTSWSSWNLYAAELARDTGAEITRTTDGGLTGPGFFDHVRNSRRPILNTPKAQDTRLPPDLVRRPVIEPVVLWAWSLVWRQTEDRPAVLAAVDAIAQHVDVLDPAAWLPADDPHKQTT